MHSPAAEIFCFKDKKILNVKRIENSMNTERGRILEIRPDGLSTF